MAVSKDDVMDATGQRTNMPGLGVMRGYGWGPQYQGTTNPIGGIKGNPINGEVGYGPGALFTNPYTTIIGNLLWVNIGTFASALWLNLDGPANFDLTTPAVVNLTASTLTVTAALHAGRLITINRNNGTTITLPAPTGTGLRYSFFVGTSLTSSSIVIDAKGGAASAVMAGNAYTQSSTGTATAYSTASNTNEIVLTNATVGGGTIGDQINLQDIGTNLWAVTIFNSETGTPATPFANH